MKTQIIFLIIAISFAVKANAQITLEHTYVTDPPNQSLDYTVNLALSGTKLVSCHSTGASIDYIKLYNSNHTVFKTIQVPQIAGWNVQDLKYISETLFDLDSLIEFLVNYSSHGNYQTVVCNENGQILLQVPDTYWALGITNFPGPLVMLDNSAKLFLKSTTSSSVSVYNLPGRLPCNECHNDPVRNVVSNVSNQMNKKTSLPYPNPTSNSIKIKYQLPEVFRVAHVKIFNRANQLIKLFNIDSTYDEIILSNDDLPSGEYFYSIEVDGKVLENNKYILIR